MPRSLYVSVAFMLFAGLLCMATAAAEDKAETGEVPAAPAPGRVACHAAVYFIWEPAPPKRLPKSPPANAAELEKKPVKELFRVAAEEADSEEDSKAALLRALPQVQNQALAVCREAHENESGCVSRKLKQFGANYTTADFQGRRAMLAAVDSDCANETGRCTLTETGTTACETIATVAPPSAAASGKETGDKETGDKDGAKQKKKK